MGIAYRKMEFFFSIFSLFSTAYNLCWMLCQTYLNILKKIWKRKFFIKRKKKTLKGLFFSYWFIFWISALRCITHNEKKINESWSFLIENHYAVLGLKCVFFTDIVLNENIRVSIKCSLKTKQNLQLKFLKLNINEMHYFLNNKYYSFIYFYEFNEKRPFFIPMSKK